MEVWDRMAGILWRERQNCGRNIREVAERSGLSVQSIKNYESGLCKGMHMDKFMALCEAIGANPSQVLGEAIAEETK